MKRNILILLIVFLISLVAGCGIKTMSVENASAIVEYSQNEDGTWISEGRIYKYKIELTGWDYNAEHEGRFVVLTNNPDITYEDVSWSFLSSQSDDFLDSNETVIVEMGVVEE